MLQTPERGGWRGGLGATERGGIISHYAPWPKPHGCGTGSREVAPRPLGPPGAPPMCAKACHCRDCGRGSRAPWHWHRHWFAAHPAWQAVSKRPLSPPVGHRQPLAGGTPLPCFPLPFVCLRRARKSHGGGERATPGAGGAAGAGSVQGCTRCPHCHGDVSLVGSVPRHLLLRVGPCEGPQPSPGPGNNPCLRTEQGLLLPLQRCPGQSWAWASPCCSRQGAGRCLRGEGSPCSRLALALVSPWAVAGGPQRPPALTSSKTDGRGCVLSCGRPTHGHQLTGMGWGGEPGPRAQPS